MFCTNYVIKKGDSLYSISRQNRIPVSAIINANPFVNVYNLQVDEVICLPVGVPQNNYTNSTAYQVEEGDTLGSVLDKSGAEMGDFMQLNNVNSIHLLPGSTVQVPVIDEGEDLSL
jgi:LysM repeat protein